MAILALGCARTPLPPSKRGEGPPPPLGQTQVQEGVASWYGVEFHGRKTSSGEPYDMQRLTAAHPTLPLGTLVRVTNLENHRTVVVRINDRGPFVKGRVIDLSYAAARVLGMVEQGTCRVRLEILERPPGFHKVDFSVRPSYALQVGSFSERTNAEDLQRRIEEMLGAKMARVVETEVGGTRIYRVLVGRFTRREEAQTLARNLAEKGMDVLVISEYPENISPPSQRGTRKDLPFAPQTLSP